MLKTFYIQVNHENKITDVIQYPHDDYKKVEFNTPLPPNILAGCYELVNDQPIYRKQWDTQILQSEQETKEIKQMLAAIIAENLKAKGVTK